MPDGRPSIFMWKHWQAVSGWPGNDAFVVPTTQKQTALSTAGSCKLTAHSFERPEESRDTVCSPNGTI